MLKIILEKIVGNNDYSEDLSDTTIEQWVTSNRSRVMSSGSYRDLYRVQGDRDTRKTKYLSCTKASNDDELKKIAAGLGYSTEPVIYKVVPKASVQGSNHVFIDVDLLSKDESLVSSLPNDAFKRTVKLEREVIVISEEVELIEV
ncbi:hypothetical protein M902_2352 [Bacteriovorax sp. BAL6_X]|uniref:hypothetical protein n=1 Tax=Bacteriovorax sp. BAL6_X TaxID=1201290 RepID=UPI000385F02E|nr:hypothetical protein [Bacteriovorax sp. BAL6_X]EPZ52052.1 hypothetical protein M902_2352 [Bacteriovorax sp. BAL6_X]